jgi:hypothetical protein
MDDPTTANSDVYSIACPSCQAQSGEQCHVRIIGKSTEPHLSRIDAYRRKWLSGLDSIQRSW